MRSANSRRVYDHLKAPPLAEHAWKAGEMRSEVDENWKPNFGKGTCCLALNMWEARVGQREG